MSEALTPPKGNWQNEGPHPENEGYVERVTPKTPDENIFFFKCSECSGSHFRHAGYVEILLPFLRAGGEKRVGLDSLPVKICVSCKHSYVWINEQMYDVSDQIDVEAWEKTERELQKMTGPGGNC
jgi:hypothetical protein